MFKEGLECCQLDLDVGREPLEVLVCGSGREQELVGSTFYAVRIPSSVTSEQLVLSGNRPHSVMVANES